MASDIRSLWSARSYIKIVESYLANKDKDYHWKDYFYISYSFRALKLYREDIKLNIKIINKGFKTQHKEILGLTKENEELEQGKYPKILIGLYWNLLNSFGELILLENEDSAKVSQIYKQFQMLQNILIELDALPEKSEEFVDNVQSYRQRLIDQIYSFKSEFFVQYISWQQEASLVNQNGSEIGLIITNKGLCSGGNAGIENYRFHFYIDACFFYGAGSVKNYNQNSLASYQQSNIPAYGLKTGPGASINISSTKSKIGIKLPLIYSIQKLESPTSGTFSIVEGSSLAFVASLYSRWQFESWHFETEFGNYLGVKQTFWGLGAGVSF